MAQHENNNEGNPVNGDEILVGHDDGTNSGAGAGVGHASHDHPQNPFNNPENDPFRNDRETTHVASSSEVHPKVVERSALGDDRGGCAHSLVNWRLSPLLSGSNQPAGRPGGAIKPDSEHDSRRRGRLDGDWADLSDTTKTATNSMDAVFAKIMGRKRQQTWIGVGEEAPSQKVDKILICSAILPMFKTHFLDDRTFDAVSVRLSMGGFHFWDVLLAMKRDQLGQLPERIYYYTFSREVIWK
ncbi:hypothetical protein M408DRAFT_8309 [Serendipita vermifera MAFF 305830]|uniref:Uncharacterized protein n=1 Tax=Serendipita vermifera MAFF 305830 TaxID=933852 RepID=A0A0C3BAW0_SERVB|nr:hypothetical protein M408DRAFT_8309 [Serendipita vermifera MAFF 305830]